MKKTTIGRLIFYPVLLIIISIAFKEQIVSAFSEHNGFDLSDALIDANEIHHAGQRKMVFRQLTSQYLFLPDRRTISLIMIESWVYRLMALPKPIP